MPCSLIFSPEQTYLPTSSEICKLFQEETMSVFLSTQENTWAFGKSMPYHPSLMGASVKSLCSRMDNVTHFLHNLILPRNMWFWNIQHIMWTSVSISTRFGLLQTNHFVPLLPADIQTIMRRAERNRTKTIGPNG